MITKAPFPLNLRGHHGHVRMVVGFTTTCAISVYHHQFSEFDPCSWRGVLNTTLCNKDCHWLVAGRWFPPPIKLTAMI